MVREALKVGGRDKGNAPLDPAWVLMSAASLLMVLVALASDMMREEFCKGVEVGKGKGRR